MFSSYSKYALGMHGGGIIGKGKIFSTVRAPSAGAFQYCYRAPPLDSKEQTVLVVATRLVNDETNGIINTTIKTTCS